MRRATFAAAAVFLALAMGASAGGVKDGYGASIDLGTGSLDLGSADLTVAGTLSPGTAGFTQARDVTIDPTGLVNGNSATLQVAGDWDNAGTFNAGTSTVQMVDGCGLLSAVIAGDTTFANLDMTTTSGFLYSFTSGSTQTVTSSLTLLGDTGNLLTIRSTLDGRVPERPGGEQRRLRGRAGQRRDRRKPGHPGTDLGERVQHPGLARGRAGAGARRPGPGPAWALAPVERAPGSGDAAGEPRDTLTAAATLSASG